MEKKKIKKKQKRTKHNNFLTNNEKDILDKLDEVDLPTFENNTDFNTFENISKISEMEHLYREYNNIIKCVHLMKLYIESLQKTIQSHDQYIKSLHTTIQSQAQSAMTADYYLNKKIDSLHNEIHLLKQKLKIK